MLTILKIILPDLSLTVNTRPSQVRTNHDQQHITHPLVDQIALASNTWQAPNRVISASYAGNPDTGTVKHANLVVNLLPHQKQRPIVDMAASQSLANARTAAEYVSRALKMRAHHKAPHSSYVKYDVYEKEETQQIADASSQIEGPRTSDHRKSSNRNTSSTTRNTKKRYADYDYNHHQQHHHHHHHHHKPEYPTPATYTHEDSSYSPQYDEESREELRDMGSTPSSPPADLPKSEIMKQIKLSVVKYMKELEAEGNFPAITAIATTVQPHTEIKTYYRFPTSTVSPPQESGHYESPEHDHQDHHHSGGYHPDTSYKSYHKNSAGKVKDIAYTSTTMQPSYSTEYYSPESVTPHIDLTFRSKARPKPIDLSALDVGQSWSHDSVYDHGGEHREHRHAPRQPAQQQHYHPSTPKPKLHFNSQTYHDINSMSYSPNKGVHSAAEDHQSYRDQHTYDTMPVRYKESGSSHSVVTEDPHQESSEEEYRGPVHVINGIPVSNPYKFNFEQLKQMYGEEREETSPEYVSSYSSSKDSGWQPSYTPKPSYSSFDVHSTPSSQSASNSEHYREPTPSSYHHNLPYESYSTKNHYNNHDVYGYQEDSKSNTWEIPNSSDSYRHHSSSDTHTSSSTQAKKPKVTKGKSSSGGNNGGSITIGITKSKKNGRRHKGKPKVKREKITTYYKKNRSLDTELKPPPMN